jgi:D-lyxose ketol-isomerase
MLDYMFSVVAGDHQQLHPGDPLRLQPGASALSLDYMIFMVAGDHQQLHTGDPVCLQPGASALSRDYMIFMVAGDHQQLNPGDPVCLQPGASASGNLQSRIYFRSRRCPPKWNIKKAKVQYVPSCALFE